MVSFSSEVRFSPPPRFIGTTLVDLLRWRALHQPNQMAYTFLADGETITSQLTYGELDRQARSIAANLQNRGLAGSRALMLYPPGLAFVTAFFGCLYADVVGVPVYPPRPNRSMERILTIVQDADAKVTLTTKSVFSELENRVAQSPELLALPWISTDDETVDLSDEWTVPLVTKDTIACLQYTSGSTSIPKGVMVSHENILHNSECIQHAFELSTESVSVSWLPHFHDMGLIDGIMQPFYTGFPGYLLSPVAFLQQPVRWLQLISRYKATHCGGPNFGFDLCTAKVTPKELEALDLSSWTSAYNGAEPVRRDTLEKFIDRFSVAGFQAKSFYPCYGLAEATLIVSGGDVDRAPIYETVEADALEQNRIVTVDDPTEKVRQLVASGHAWLDTQIVVVNPETLMPCAEEQVGEIWVSGRTIAQGYWNRPIETAETFQARLTSDPERGPFLRTGDLGFLKNGELFVTGRLKDLIIIRGRNHYPQDIEQTVVDSHAALRAGCSAAFSVPVNDVEQLVIVQEIERSHLRQLNAPEVIESIRFAVRQHHELQVYAIALIKTQSISKTSSGKIQRRACRDRFLNDQLNVLEGGSWSVSDRRKP